MQKITAGVFAMEKEKVFVIMPLKMNSLKYTKCLKCSFLKNFNSAMPEKKKISKMF
jgi:hypothetical protein